MLLVTAAEMRELDRLTIEGGHARGETLMEHAGAGVVAAMARRYGSLLGLRVLVLSGTGNNGGDGFVAARLLREHGADLRVGLVGDPARVRGDASLHFDRARGAGVTVEPLDSEAAIARLVATRDGWDFALDALLGTGAQGQPEGTIAAAVQALRDLDDRGTRVVAVDLPTGVNADTGQIARRAVRADLTVTFGAPKRGHVLYPGRAFAGALEVVDIGLVDPAAAGLSLDVEVATAIEMADLIPARDPRAHKSSTGRVLVVGGSVGLSGAVALAAHAATRAGAGYVQACVPASLNDVLEVKLTEEMTIPCAETAGRTLALAALERLSASAVRVDVVALGSGMSRDPEAAEVVRRLAGTLGRPLVLDADGLNAFEGHGDALARLPVPRVLTPHVGEMARLTGLAPEVIEARRIDGAIEWARAWDAVVVLKGAPTVTAAPDGRAMVNPTGNPGLATAGTGDVLTGVIAALVAQGLAPYDAARLGVYVHGLAADRAAERRGQHGLAARDVLAATAGAMRQLVRLRDAALEFRDRTARPAPG